MQDMIRGMKVSPLIGLALVGAVFAADQPASPGNPPPDAPVSRQEYNQLKKDYEDLRQEMGRRSKPPPRNRDQSKSAPNASASGRAAPVGRRNPAGGANAAVGWELISH